MKFVKTENLKRGMRLAKPIYNKKGVMLYERDSKLSAQGITSINNFGLIGVYILEPAEPVPPMTEEDIEFERFQAMYVFIIRDILDSMIKRREPEGLYTFANRIIRKYGNMKHKINFVQNLRSNEDYVYKHSLNTAILCALMAHRYKIDFKRQLDVVVAAIMFDLGTLMIPVNIRNKPLIDRTEEDFTAINTYYVAAYQMIRQSTTIEDGAKAILSRIFGILHDVGPNKNNDGKSPVNTAVDILKIASIYDDMTAMRYNTEPMSDLAAIRRLIYDKDEFNPKVVEALVDSINILEPGVCIEFTNGEKGLVIAGGAPNVLEPFVLSFRDNKIYNMGDKLVQANMQIKDIMKTMDNRHVVDNDMLKNYVGKTVHIGEKM